MEIQKIQSIRPGALREASNRPSEAHSEELRIVPYKDAILDPTTKVMIDFHGSEARITGPLEVVAAPGHKVAYAWNLDRNAMTLELSVMLSEADLEHELYINIKQYTHKAYHDEQFAKMNIFVNDEHIVANFFPDTRDRFQGRGIIVDPNSVKTDHFLIPSQTLKVGENRIGINAQSPHWIGNPRIQYFIQNLSITEDQRMQIIQW